MAVRRPARKRRGKAALPAGGKRLTIRDIAEQAGVSTATVSRVLNDSERVSDAVRSRVRKVVRRHHYVSHGLASGLASSRSGLIGLVIPTITNSIYASSTQAIQRAAQQSGYTVLVGVSEFSVEREEILIHKLVERRVDGIILTGRARAPRIYEMLRRNSVPFVVTWKLTTESEIPCVSFDNWRAAHAATEHLVSLGHRRIALVCGRTELNDRAAARRDGYLACLKSHGLKDDPGLVFERDFEFVEGRSAMRLLLRRRHPPTAVFCANDIQAIGALHECRESGVSVPGEVSIMGFDDLPISQYTHPQLTTVRVPADEMGRRAAESLLGFIGGGRGEVHVELQTDLIVRQSTAQPPAASRAGGRRRTGKRVA